MQAWGVCADKDKPRLPGVGFDYDVDDIKLVRSMPSTVLLAEHPECGTLPFVVRSNRAGRHGGGKQHTCIHKSCKCPLSRSKRLDWRLPTYLCFCKQDCSRRHVPTDSNRSSNVGLEAFLRASARHLC